MVSTLIRAHADAAAQRFRDARWDRRWTLDAIFLDGIEHVLRCAVSADTLYGVADNLAQAGHEAMLSGDCNGSVDLHHITRQLRSEADTWPR